VIVSLAATFAKFAWVRKSNYNQNSTMKFVKIAVIAAAAAGSLAAVSCCPSAPAQPTYTAPAK
jgi:hypothetical protein